MARDLRLIRIDDQGAPGTIRDWWDVQKYWSQPEVPIPDLVVCDINFDHDYIGPLKEAHPKRPTGLLYALPFLSISRASSLPCVLKFHSGDRTLFARLHEPDPNALHSPPPHVMSYFAAELAGVAAAILRSPDVSTPLTMESAWDWLSDPKSVYSSPLAAEAAARNEYRRQLIRSCGSQNNTAPRLVVDPSGYEHLVSWCQAIAQQGTIAETDWDLEPGISLITPDGRRESLRLRSLFGEIESQKFTPKDFALPPTQQFAGADEPAEDAWVTEKRGVRVRVGEFVAALGNWPHLYAAANQHVAGFPLAPVQSAQTINEVVPKSLPGYRLVRLLVMVFQAVRLYWHARTQWRDAYTSFRWEPRDQRFLEADDRGTLREILQRLHEALSRASEGAPLMPRDVGLAITERGWAGLTREDYLRLRLEQRLPDWVQFHLRLLEGLGLLTLQTQAGEYNGWYYVRRGTFPTESIPTCPRELDGYIVKDFQTSLGVSLGSAPRDAPNVLRRIASDALFGNQDQNRGGKEFIQEFNSGSLPEWLRELGRMYAERELGWHEETHWPLFLRTR